MASRDEQERPLQVFPQQSGVHPPGNDAVSPISPIAPQRGGPAARTRHRHLLRDGAVLVEQVRPDVRRRDPETPDREHAFQPLALAPRRDVREDQRRAALPVAGGGSRRRGAGKLQAEPCRCSRRVAKNGTLARVALGQSINSLFAHGGNPLQLHRPPLRRKISGQRGRCEAGVCFILAP